MVKKTVNRETLVNLIRDSKGAVFNVSFIKRSTGEPRTMLAKYGVKTHLKGGELAFSPKEKNLIVVWDTQEESYKTIPIEGLTSLTINKTFYKVKD